MASSTLGSHYSITLFFFLIMFVAFVYQATSRTIHEEIIHTKHEQWMARHERVYESRLEKEKRFKIFKANVEFIDNFNEAGNRTFTLGTNKFTDLTTDEFMASHTGHVMPSPESSSTMSSKTFRYQYVNNVPDSIDWRELGAVTNVKNQYQCACCWAFSAVAALEGAHKIKTGELISLSEQQIVDCSGRDGCYPNYMDHAYEYVMYNGGLTTESAYPYMGDEGGCGYTRNRYGAINSYEDVPHNDEAALQRAVAHQPVAVGIDPSSLQHYRRGVINGGCGTDLTHAVTIVGYDTNEYGMNYWICKNSWGTNWGDDGYFLVQRDSGRQGGMCGVAIQASYPVA